ncbi:peptidylprolyl isomerase [Prosthecomicrobium hirschii]|uniref:peptidylprolyl isomerase n=1 Tax=Prosthecodimorpha hirschii TaxID=665126 RepID=UPI00112C47E6|nr:peptidylprolyl isomerase [Prosthecomicrobium hirschii]TPQ51442.1 peptidylprolyl isomerase [Prosthecomicrobium hirschii]
MIKASRIAVLAALLVSAAVIGSAGWAPAAAAEDKKIATVDGKAITESDLAAVMAEMSQQFAQLPEPARRRAALDRLIDIQILAGQADKDGLSASDEFKKRLENLRQRLLINEFVKIKVDGSVTDADVKAAYDKYVGGTTPPEETRARHILVKTKEEADAIIADIAKGGDFAKIATEKSQDPGSAKEGGDLGYFGAGEMVAEFDKAVQELKPGEFTKAPVKTQFGFHVIRVEDKRKQKVPGLDEVKDQLRQQVVQEKFSEALTELKKAAKVDIDEAALGAKK